MVADRWQTATARGALPLLSFAASRLWEARDRGRKLLTVAAYNEMGGVGGAFARHADQVASAVPPQSQILLRAILTRLVTPEGTRAVIDQRELLTLSADQAEVERILDQLVRARLIHMHTDPTQGATVEIVHEMLITEWPALHRWLEDNQAMRAFMGELRAAAKQWAARGRPADLVWRGAVARDALDHVKRQLLDLSAMEKEFIAEVRKHSARARRRRVLVFTSIFTALGLVIAGGSFALVRIKLAEKEAKAKAAEATGALGEAQTARKQAEQDRAKAEAASTELKAQYEKLAETQRQREAAEQQVAAAKAGEELSQEQLAAANKELQRKVAEAQAAQARAQANEALAKKSTDEAKAANGKIQKMLDQQKAENERLKREKSKIIDQKL